MGHRTPRRRRGVRWNVALGAVVMGFVLGTCGGGGSARRLALGDREVFANV